MASIHEIPYRDPAGMRRVGSYIQLTRGEDDPEFFLYFFLDFLTLEEGTDVVPKRRRGITILRCVTCKNGAQLITTIV